MLGPGPKFYTWQGGGSLLALWTDTNWQLNIGHISTTKNTGHEPKQWNFMSCSLHNWELRVGDLCCRAQNIISQCGPAGKRWEKLGWSMQKRSCFVLWGEAFHLAGKPEFLWVDRKFKHFKPKLAILVENKLIAKHLRNRDFSLQLGELRLAVKIQAFCSKLFRGPWKCLSGVVHRYIYPFQDLQKQSHCVCVNCGFWCKMHKRDYYLVGWESEFLIRLKLQAVPQLVISPHQTCVVGWLVNNA